MKQKRTIPWFVWIIGIGIASSLILWPLLKNGFFISDDGEWMVIRLTAFFQTLKDGQFPVRYLNRLNNNYGYPVANFLYPGFLYLGSILRLLGFSYVNDIKILLVFSVIAAAICIFYWLRTHFSHIASFIGTLGFLYTPYIAFDIYKRGSVGELLALFPASLSLWAVESGAAWVLPLSVAFLIVSHNTIAFMFVPIILMYLVYKKKWNFLFPFAVGIGLATFFWFPAFFEQRYVLFNALSVSKPSEYFVNFLTLNLLGFVSIGGLIVVVFSKKEKNAMTWFACFIFSVASFFTLPLSLPFWSIRPFANVVQFPYRFAAVSAVFGAWLIASMWSKLKGKYLWIGLMLFAVLWIMPLSYWLTHIQFVEREMGYYTTNEATTTVADEYLPIWAKEKIQVRPQTLLEIYQGSATISPDTQLTQKIQAHIHVVTPAIIQINKIFYPGWGVRIDGNPVAVSYDTKNGLMRVEVPTGDHTFSAEFHETLSRFIADLVSIVFLFVYFLFIIFQLKSRWKGIKKK
jgi:hypothetical protein